MTRDLCLVYANCQGEALAPLLEASPEFAARFEIRHYLNYVRSEEALEAAGRCQLLLHQYLAPKWGEYSTAQVLPLLPESAASIVIPNFFFKGYWPFWTSDFDGIEFADSLLESLIAKGLPYDAILNLYLRMNSALMGDVEKVAMDSIAREREKEEAGPIKYADYLEENWRKRQLFLTINHPGRELLLLAANGILELLGFMPLPDNVLKKYEHPQGDFWLPIHPLVGARLKLPFAGADRKYECFGARLTHREYISRYLACREHGLADLTGVLKALAEDGAASSGEH